MTTDVRDIIQSGLSAQGIQGATGIQGIIGSQGTTGATGSGGAKLPETPVSSPNSADDEFDGESFDTDKWTRDSSFSSGSAPTVYQNGGSCILIVGASTMHSYLQNVSGTFKIRGKVRAWNTNTYLSAWGNYEINGLCIAYSTTKIIHYGMYYADAGYRLGVYRYNGASQVSGVYNDNYGSALNNAVVGAYLEIESDGTNLYFRASPTGHEGTFVQTTTETIASFLGSAPTKIGFGCWRGATMQGGYAIDFFRRVA